MTRRNPLLAVPPKGVHGLGVAGGQFFERHVGRRTTDEDYHGVHTTTSKAIAATYATGSTYSQFWDGHYVSDDPDAYPVILSLNVGGLRAVPDVDALAQAAFLLADKGIRGQYDGMELYEAFDVEEDQMDLRVGSDVAGAVMESIVYGRGPTAAFANLADDEDQWATWLRTGKYSEEAAIALVQQKRYMNDFDADRLVIIEAMQPWWPYLLEEPYDEESEAELERIDAAGYKTVTIEDIENDNVLTLKTIARGDAKDRNVEYHGTSSTSAQLAFPSLTLPRNPFPIRSSNPSRSKARASNPRERRMASRLAKGTR